MISYKRSGGCTAQQFYSVWTVYSAEMYSKCLRRMCPFQIAALTAQVDGVHVCGPLVILSCLTYIFPTHSPTILTLLFTVWPDPFGFFVSPFWARHHTFHRKSFYCLPWLQLLCIAILLHIHSTQPVAVALSQL